MPSAAADLSILFFPFMAQGHTLPMLDMAKLFALRGVATTILTTPANAPLIQPYLDRANANALRVPMRLRTAPFPSPLGRENLSAVPAHEVESLFFQFVDLAEASLREPFGSVLRDLLPDCVVTDVFFPWTYDVVAELGVPRLVFHGTNLFSLTVTDSLKRYDPLAEDASTVVPRLPHRFELLRSRILKFEETQSELFSRIRESEARSYGVAVNSFYELEPDYLRYYNEVVGVRTWHLGPLALCNRDGADRSVRGYEAAIGHDACVEWLDGKKPGSVVYVCFGSMSDFSSAQLREMALALEASGRPFVWVVRSKGDEWVPEGFEERTEGRGLIIKGWSPQILILNHRSVGGFVTHCGWNSCLEGVSAGLPLVTWPRFAEQYYNERLIVDVLKIGVSVTKGEEGSEVVEAATIAKAIGEVMGGGKEGEERRRRATGLGEMARRAVEKGGSSYEYMTNLIQELSDRNAVKKGSSSSSNRGFVTRHHQATEGL